MKAVFALILVAIALFVGMQFIPNLNHTVSTITTAAFGSGVSGMIGVVLIVFAALIIFIIVMFTFRTKDEDKTQEEVNKEVIEQEKETEEDKDAVEKIK